MTEILVDCPVHGPVGASHVIHIEASNVTIGGGSTNCPICGRMAAIIEGTYSADGRGNVRANLKPTPAQRIRLDNVFAWASDRLADSGVDYEIVAKNVERALAATPVGAAVLEKVDRSQYGTVADWVAVLIALMALFVSANQNETITEDDVQQMINETVSQTQTYEPPAPSPGLNTRTVEPLEPERRDPDREEGIERPRS